MTLTVTVATCREARSPRLHVVVPAAQVPVSVATLSSVVPGGSAWVTTTCVIVLGPPL